VRILALQETDWVERNPIMHHRMLEALSRREADVTVLDYEIFWRTSGRRRVWQTRREIRDSYKFFADAKVRLIRPAMLRIPGLGRLSWLLGTWWELRALIRRQRPDVVVAYGISNALLGYLVARKNEIPFVYHLLDALHTLAEPPALRPIARVVESAVIRRADRVIVINRALGDYAVGMGASRKRVEIIPPGSSSGSAEASDGNAVRTSLGIHEAELALLFAGWLYQFSGMRELVVEFARRSRRVPNVRVVIVGDGDLYPELTELVAANRLEDQVILTGRRPRVDIPAYLAASDVCLLPALAAPAMTHIVPAKVTEYMDAGKPIIATRLPGIEAEFGSLPGILYVDHPEQVLDHVARLLEAPDPRAAARDLGATCLAFQREREDWEAVTGRFANALATVQVRRSSAPVA
jgi:glycosyltransferase involved in cell wall biosynthesis